MNGASSALLSDLPSNLALIMGGATASVSPTYDSSLNSDEPFPSHYFAREYDVLTATHLEAKELDLSKLLEALHADILDAPFASLRSDLQGDHEPSGKTELLEDLRQLENYLSGASGSPELAASVIEDAVTLLQSWPTGIPLPCLDFDDDAMISLDIIDDSGRALAGFDILGKDHAAAFSVIADGHISAAKSVNTQSPTEIIRAFQMIESVLEANA